MTVCRVRVDEDFTLLIPADPAAEWEIQAYHGRYITWMTRALAQALLAGAVVPAMSGYEARLTAGACWMRVKGGPPDAPWTIAVRVFPAVALQRALLPDAVAL